MTRLRIFLAATSAGALVSGCMVGPDFHRPEVAAPAAFARVADAAAPSRPSEATASPDWWALFGDPELVALETRLAGANLDVKAATARLLQSRAERRVAGARELPSLGAAGS